MKRTRVTTNVFFGVAIIALSGAIAAAITPAVSASSGPVPAAGKAAAIERGAYLVRTMGCNDCHTPWKPGPMGPEPDMTRALTGHPADMVMPPPPALPPGPWLWMGAATNTAFAGPWGVSFTANLTPDPETGLGQWTEEMFLQTLRTGRHEGKGRPILPPMPVKMIGQLNDEDLKSIFAYLQSLAPVKNRVPQPIDPPETK
jgi:mono/diheme cytochrome c family protein